ncbi:MAG: EamA family transporter [Alphaproteobacteria bacterium]|nr:EamA family transporter [Alphaproteobacteria bacterium]
MKPNLVVQAFLFGLLAAFFWGTHSVIVRYLTGDLPGITIAVLRLYIAAFVLYLIMRAYKRPVSIDFTDRNFLITTFGATTNYIFFHIGLEHTSASNAMMLENTAPFFVLVFLFVVVKERIGRTEVVATMIALLGVYLTVRHDISVGGEGIEGDILEVAAGLTWAIFLMGSSKALSTTVSTIERISFLFNVFILSAVVLTPLVFFYPFDATTDDILLLVLLGVFPTAAAYYLWYEAAARVSTVSATLLFTLSIVFTFVNAHIFLGEPLTSNMIIGAVLIVAGVILSKLGGRKT